MSNEIDEILIALKSVADELENCPSSRKSNRTLDIWDSRRLINNLNKIAEKVDQPGVKFEDFILDIPVVHSKYYRGK